MNQSETWIAGSMISTLCPERLSSQIMVREDSWSEASVVTPPFSQRTPATVVWGCMHYINIGDIGSHTDSIDTYYVMKVRLYNVISIYT